MGGQPLVFQGEFDVEDDTFECIVDRLIVRGQDFAFQLSGFYEGGKFVAEGHACRLSNGVIATTDFRLRYESDREDSPAWFRLLRVELSPKKMEFDIDGEWMEGGKTWQMKALLARFKQSGGPPAARKRTAGR